MSKISSSLGQLKHAFYVLIVCGWLLIPGVGAAAQITLAWDQYNNIPNTVQATQINVYRRDNVAGTSHVVIGNVPVTQSTFSYAADVVLPGYCYVITAAAPPIESAQSNEVCDLVPLPPPGAPVNLRIQSTVP